MREKGNTDERELIAKILKKSFDCLQRKHLFLNKLANMYAIISTFHNKIEIFHFTLILLISINKVDQSKSIKIE